MRSEHLSTLSGQRIQGPLLLKPLVFEDERGFFYESWNEACFNELLKADGQQVCRFVQDNHSASVRAVLRGLHYQLPPHPQAKLVRCVAGEIFDVAVDLRRHSSTFGCWVAARLSAVNCHQLWIPEGFAHGFLTLSERAEVLYKASEFWHAECERTLRWNDKDVSVEWPSVTESDSFTLLLSAKDTDAPSLSSLDDRSLFS